MDRTSGLNPSDKTPILIGASTWDGEEAFLINFAAQQKTSGNPLRLLLVPRHAERRNEIERQCQASQVELRLPQQNPPTENPDIYIADTTGELTNWVQTADFVFIGKSFEPHKGGQTPSKPPNLANPSFTVPRMTNFKAVCEGLEASKGATRAKDFNEAEAILKNWLKAPHL